MKGDRIPETDTISRYCPYTKISETGKPLGSAFMPRARDLESENPHISVNWLEYFKQATKQGQIQEIRNILSIKMKVNNSAKLAILKVNDIYKQFKNTNYKPKILHWPDQTEDYTDPSHAGIFDIETDPDVIADIIAQIDCEMVPAKA